jgi:hypothetical protein
VLKSYFNNSTALRLKKITTSVPLNSSSAILKGIHMPFLRDMDESGEGAVLLFPSPASPASGWLQWGYRSFFFLTVGDSVVKWVRRTIDAHESAIMEVRENLTVVSELRMQQINTTLSLVGTIFLPLTFLTGVYGMNFMYHGEYPVGIQILNEK